MCWNAPRRRPALSALAGLWAVFGLGLAVAQDAPQGAEQPVGEALLVTYGPGDIYWQRFGHNAIWLREPSRGLDHTFNFGFFDFEQENFLLRFVQGRMLYFAAAVPVQREMDYYRSHGRSVRVQALDLEPQQYIMLRDYLLRHVQPEHRDYLYDYYLDNCSTRLRDALDLALGGSLLEQFGAQPGLQTFRDHTRRSTLRDYWYYLGLEAALGIPVDRPVSRWEEMFLPAVLADSLGEVTRRGEDGLRALVQSDELLANSQVSLPPGAAPEIWPRYLLLALGLLAMGWVLARWAPPILADGLVQAWMLNAGVLGILLVAVWLWTDHGAAHPNTNLLLFNPLLVLALVPALRRPVAVITTLLALGAVCVLAMPWLQYTRDVAALVLPVNLACAWRLWRHPAPPRMPRRWGRNQASSSAS